MTEKKTPRGLAGHNEAQGDNNRIAHLRLRSKVRRSVLYGTVAGAVAAVIIGGLMIEEIPVTGFITSLLGIGWLALFWMVNKEDHIYDTV